MDGRSDQSYWQNTQHIPVRDNDTLAHFFNNAKEAAQGAGRWMARQKKQQTPLLNHPLLEALRKSEHGSVRLTTPEGRIMHLGMSNAGPKADWQLHDWHVLDAIMARGEMGLAETYVSGQWDSDDLAGFLTHGLNNAKVLEQYFYGHFWFSLFAGLRNLFRKNSIWRARRNVLDHYDLGNDFYSLWLDKSMTYSCGLFAGEERTLEEAQQAKYARILEKLELAPGSHVLDIGCGWGGFAEAAARSGLRVTGITLSDEQRDFAVERMKRNGLSDQVEIKLLDYRKLTGVYDGIASIGMFEHVGMRYWPDYFRTLEKHLKPGGKAMIQSIYLDEEVFSRVRGKYGFIEQVIFPGGVLPSQKAFVNNAQKSGLECCGIYSFGQDYARTLRHWLQRFEAHKSEIRAMGYDEFFIRLWRFYLACCIASFVSKRSGVMQAELRHPLTPAH